MHAQEQVNELADDSRCNTPDHMKVLAGQAVFNWHTGITLTLMCVLTCVMIMLAFHTASPPQNCL